MVAERKSSLDVSQVSYMEEKSSGLRGLCKKNHGSHFDRVVYEIRQFIDTLQTNMLARLRPVSIAV
jgi:hypothetical protein